MKVRHKLVYLFVIMVALLVALWVWMIAVVLATVVGIPVFPPALVFAIVVLAVAMVAIMVAVIASARAPPWTSSAKAGSNVEMEASKMRSSQQTVRVDKRFALSSWRNLQHLVHGDAYSPMT